MPGAGASARRPVLALVASAAGGVERWLVAGLARPLAERGWRLAVTLTPTVARWLEPDLPALAATTDLPVRWTSRLPTEPKPHPVPDAYAFAPATANSIAKLALGIGDNQALTILCEGLGRRAPVVVMPQVSAEHAAHPAFDGHLDVLRSAGVLLVPDPPAVLRELERVGPFAAFTENGGNTPDR
ncbi:flavoprotein [Saccharothrix syringae]|uniref:Flavoprotein n=1 Tax=Saccharothrix syringae TaxID=103733 RepID=A0A5Q0HFQ8_SACSY|nr:flavoprotein [Saccharothrix syringae]